MRKLFLMPALAALAGCTFDAVDIGQKLLIFTAADVVFTGQSHFLPHINWPSGNNVVPDQYRKLICNDGHFTYGPVDRCNPGDTLVRDETPEPKPATAP